MSIECRVPVCTRFFFVVRDKQKTTPFREWFFVVSIAIRRERHWWPQDPSVHR